ncbi:GNAT family N-acetyltransferase [Asanoa sp. NPDC049518]|uniref:bifunctional acetate--CoA ligase family protein/GNAT family N-acetyltransferase n=1 Tax=unclassified Asanoa TaxID=2685164 RepID=UPI003427096D
MTDRAADVLLSDGTTVHVRQIEPTDAPAIVETHARFSERTRYLRYFSPYPRIPERDLHRFVTVDHRDREAFVVEVGGRIVAIGRYDRLGPDAGDAEVAFVVEDAYQGRGIGPLLMEYLAAAARETGITRFVAEVLPANATMLRVFSDFGYEVERRYADGVVHLAFPIAPTESSLEVQWRREHRTEARSIARLLAPRGVAVYGASSSGHGVGAAVLGHLRDGGFAGPVVPVHPSAPRVGGLAAVSRASDAGVPLDLGIVTVPPEKIDEVVDDAARAGLHALVVVSAGFAEADQAGAAAQAELIRRAHAGGMRVVGPNCLGIANTDPAVRLNATLAPRLPAPGRIGFFSQSGALGVALLAEADRRGLGLSTFVSAGNRADVSGNDLLQYWRDDPGTDVILLYLESFGNPRKFARLARGIGRNKPIVAVASPVRPPGSTERGLDPASVRALFARSGVIRVDTVGELFDVGALLATQPLPGGPRVGIVGNSPALTTLAEAACVANGLVVADGYPRDVGPVAGAHEFGDRLAEASADQGVDALAVVLAPPLPGQLQADDADFAATIAGVALTGDKPVVVTSLVDRVPLGIPAYPSVEEAARALGRVAHYAEWRRQPPGTVPPLSGVDTDAAAAAVGHDDREGLLAAYGIPLVPDALVDSAPEAVAAARRLGLPTALKAAGMSLRHRIDLGAVRLDLRDEEAVRVAYRELAESFGPQVLVQPMVPAGVACVVEMMEDPAFGPVVGFGLAGVATELLGDRAWRPAPLSDRAAAALVDEPRAAPLLKGYRGAAPVDRDALVDLLLRVGRLADEQPRVRSLSLHPVLARPDGLSVLHATMTFGDSGTRPDTGPRHI